MRIGAKAIGVSFNFFVLATLILAGTAWSQLGSVLSHQKISDTAGNLTADLGQADEFGSCVATLGDLDGAGPSAAAIAVGAIGDNDGGGNRGATYVLFLGSNGNILSEQKISNTEGGFTASLDNGDEFGTSAAGLGDLDGGGPSVAALAVGAAADGDGGTTRGALYVLFLNSSGTVLSHQKISSTAGGFAGALDNADEFGNAVAHLGDLDGAGPSVGAVAVAATGDDDGGLNRGAVYILFLNSTGSVLSHQKISNTEGSFTATLDNADEFGSSLAYLGDLDGPGPSAGALAVGAVGDDDGGGDHGAVYILFLSSSGSVLSYQKISDTEGGFTASLDTYDEFGGALTSLGDLDTHGPSAVTLGVGTIGDDDGGSGYGAVYVLFLDGSGSVLSHQKISATEGNFTGSLSPADEFGTSVVGIGDLGGAGPPATALVVGASFDDDGAEDAGCVWNLFLISGQTPVEKTSWSDMKTRFR